MGVVPSNSSSGDTLPVLGQYFPIRETPGLYSLTPDPDKPTPPLYMGVAECPEVLLRREYGTDAHFVAYWPRDHGEYPRCNKTGTLLAEMIALHGPDCLLANYLVYDVDNPSHAPHATAAAAHAHLARLWHPVQVGTEKSAGPRPAFAYTSRHGFRVGYLLQAPVTVTELERVHKAFLPRVQVIAGVQLIVDPGCSDWTRSYRVPKGTRTAPLLESSHAWYALRIATPAECTRLDPALILAQVPNPQAPIASTNRALTLPVRTASSARAVAGVHDTPPDDNQCSDLLEELEGASRALQIELRRRTRGRLCDPFLWRNQELALPGGRSNAIFRIGGDAVRWFYPCPGATPELLYALFWQQVACWEPDSVPAPHTHSADGRGWLLHLWDALTTFWIREVQKDPAPDETRNAQLLVPERAQRQQSLLGRMIEGVRTWPASPVAGTDAQDAQLWILRHLIAVVGGSREEYYLLRPDGYYEVTRVSSSALIPAIRDLGLDELISLDSVTASGAVRPRTAAELVREHGTRVTERLMRIGVVGPEGHPGGVWQAARGGTAASSSKGDGAGVYAGGSGRLEYSTFARRTDVTPQYDADVEQWLRQLAGERYTDLCRWIAYALAFEEGPICALALRGEAGAGKKLFARGLAEAIWPPGRFATGHDLGLRRYGLMNSPFLLIDEGIPDAIPLSDRADVFRQLIAGERVRVQELYSAPADVCNPVRCLFTTNNLDVIGQLAGGRDLSADDRDALARRLILIEIPAGTSVWLETKGGIEWTRGWIDGDGGEPGDARVARHFLALHAQRHRWPTGRRFLVEGSEDPEVRHALLIATPTGAAMIEGIVKLIEEGGSDSEIRVVKGVVWVTTSAVVDQLRQISKRAAGVRVPSAKTVGTALPSFCLSGQGVQRWNNARFHALDLAMLAREAETMGLRCTRLLGILSNEIKDVNRGTILKMVGNN